MNSLEDAFINIGLDEDRFIRKLKGEEDISLL